MKKIIAALFVMTLIFSSVGSYVFNDNAPTAEAKKYKSGQKSFNKNNNTNTNTNNNSNIQNKDTDKKDTTNNNSTTTNKSTSTADKKGGFMSRGLIWKGFDCIEDAMDWLCEEVPKVSPYKNLRIASPEYLFKYGGFWFKRR